MNDSFRLRVLMALTDSLAQITPANGFQHDLTGSVFRGRSIFTHKDPLPMLSIMEPPQMPDQMESPSASTQQSTNFPLLIQGFVDDDRENPTDPAYRLLADVQKRLAYERARQGGYDILGFEGRVMALHIGKGVVRSPDEIVSKDAFFWLPVTLEFAEDHANPFA